MENDTHSLGAWRPWSPKEAARLFARLTAPWWISGGWAIDLFLGRQTRQHDDIDIQFLRRDQRALRALFDGWDIQAALPPPRDETWPFQFWRLGETLDTAIHDIWCRRTPAQPWALQFMLAEAQEDTWVFRRTPAITRPLAEIGCVTADGIPHLAPEVQLLYKAKGLRSKDEADFTAALPALDRKRRQWLSNALAETHPDHPWLERLSVGSGV